MTLQEYWREYERRVRVLEEACDMTTSDAQGVADFEFPMPKELLP